MVPDLESAESPVNSKKNSASSNSTMVVTDSKAKLGKNPDKKAGVLKSLKKGEVVKVIKEKNEWLYIELANGDLGWCLKSVLVQKTGL